MTPAEETNDALGPSEAQQDALTEEWNLGFDAGYESALMNVVSQLKNGPRCTVEDAIDHVRKMWIEAIERSKRD